MKGWENICSAIVMAYQPYYSAIPYLYGNLRLHEMKEESDKRWREAEDLARKYGFEGDWPTLEEYSLRKDNELER